MDHSKMSANFTRKDDSLSRNERDYHIVSDHNRAELVRLTQQE